VCATAAVLAAALSAGACGKKPPVTEPPPPPAPAPAPPTRPDPPPAPAPPPATTPKELTEDELFAKMTLDELNKKGALTDVFFALDSTELTQESRAAIQKNVDYMKRWTSTKVMVEGHADSRGTNEYNLALAERRAGAVRDYMVSLGLPADRLTIVSKGEEAPFCTEENESCWQQNRRGHFVFTAK
jgi:peptidoglycan-associated lipoprotein